MREEHILEAAKGIYKTLQESSGSIKVRGAWTEALEFLKIYAGEDSNFYVQAKKSWNAVDPMKTRGQTLGIMEAFIRFLERGLLDGNTIQRQAQIDSVSEFLDQAEDLLNDVSVHPAAPTMVMGAALEEFLRGWFNDEGLPLGEKKPGIENYAGSLRSSELITKQDKKQITVWSGLRNHAAHGEFEEVEDRDEIIRMLEGVAAFFSKYG